MKILMIDDDHDFAASLAELLSLEAIDVDVAHNGRAAIRAIRESHYDQVIVDVGLPDMSGTACACALLAARPDMRILIITGYSAADVDQSVVESNAMQVLTKPLDPEGLLRMLKPAVAS